MPNSLDSFIPSPGNLLVEDIEDKTPFGSKNKPQGNTAVKAKVLKVGFDYVNDFGQVKTAPCKVNDIILYEEMPTMPNPHFYDGFKEYPIVLFSRVLGVVK